mmetsp:Transcript_35699/g.53219  ORF Transcript_35699/g.53219 Transcript_35699/m.53219 type:complete len:297 (+) Transcript_35699:247-1137(+)
MSSSSSSSNSSNGNDEFGPLSALSRSDQEDRVDNSGVVESKDADADDDERTVTTHNSSNSVKFDANVEIIELIPLPDELSQEERQSVWWTMDDYQEFSETAHHICKEVRRHGALTTGLDEALKRSERAAKMVDESRVEEVITKISADPGLAQWCTHGHSRRGLERSGSRYHNSFRGVQAQDTRACALLFQSNLSREELRTEYLLRSRSARIFARLMGEADAIAATRTPTMALRRWSDLGSTTTSNPQLGGVALPGYSPSGAPHPSSLIGGHQLILHHRQAHRTSSLPRQGLVRTTL